MQSLQKTIRARPTRTGQWAAAMFAAWFMIACGGSAGDGSAEASAGEEPGGSNSGGNAGEEQGGASVDGGSAGQGQAGVPIQGGAVSGGTSNSGGSAGQEQGGAWVDGGSAGQGQGGASVEGGSAGQGQGGASVEGGSAGQGQGGTSSGGTSVGGGDGSGGMIITGCLYDDIPGTATVSSIELASQDDGTLCAGEGYNVVYAFAPDDTTIPESAYQASNFGMNEARFQRIYIPDNLHSLPSTSCLELAGVEVGDQFPLTRRVEVQGTCTPVVDTFDPEPLQICVGMCF